MLESGKEEEIVITRYDKKVAKIVLFKSNAKKKRLGAAIGMLKKTDFVLKDPTYKVDELFGY